MAHAFEFIGSRVVQSLHGVSWATAWISLEIVDKGVVRRTQRFRPLSGGPDRDFQLVDPIGVARAVESLREEMLQQGAPRWIGLVMKISETGDYQFEYRYHDSGPSRLLAE